MSVNCARLVRVKWQACIPEKMYPVVPPPVVTPMSVHNTPGSPLSGRDIVLLIRQALGFIPSDDRDIWIRCGMAIKAELGEAGYELWDQWSSTSDK
jgi:putative DNA primase/helicase